MATTQNDGGFDFEKPLRDKAHQLGAALAENGVGALLDEVEQLLPDEVREQVVRFPFLAVALGVGVGVYLGMKKGDEILAAGAALVTSTAMANVSQFMDRMSGNS